jgi:hypothetical protein
MTKALSFDLYARAATILGSLFLLSIIAYGALILLMVQETSYRARAEQSSRVITGELSVLEKKYLSVEESVTLEKAQTLGFVEAKQIARVNRFLPVTALSLRNE